eukprot:10290164-Lingulodinium_polyedra.AAC.1
MGCIAAICKHGATAARMPAVLRAPTVSAAPLRGSWLQSPGSPSSRDRRFTGLRNKVCSYGRTRPA